MKLRNLLINKDASYDEIMQFMTRLNEHNGDTAVVNRDYEFKKLPYDLEDLIARNMDLIEKLIDEKIKDD